jgi:CheY-like chemotaxis protein
MPNMNGLEFVTHLRALDFPGKIMVFSSELSEAIARLYREQHVDRILYKPILPSALRTHLAALFPA